MRTQRAHSIGAAAALCALLFGCAASAAKPGGGVPDWVKSPPAADQDFMYFTGSGMSKENDQAKAEEAARATLMDSIMQYVGVTVTSETTATAKASLDSFKSDVVQQLKTTGSGRISGLEMKDKYLDKSDSGTTVWLLARYNKADLLKEKKRLEEIARVRDEARRSLDAITRQWDHALQKLKMAVERRS